MRPGRQATAQENAATLHFLWSSIQLDHLPADSFVGFQSSLRNRQSYAGRRGFFLLANARSRLRRCTLIPNFS